MMFEVIATLLVLETIIGSVVHYVQFRRSQRGDPKHNLMWLLMKLDIKAATPPLETLSAFARSYRMRPEPK